MKNLQKETLRYYLTDSEMYQLKKPNPSQLNPIKTISF